MHDAISIVNGNYTDREASIRDYFGIPEDRATELQKKTPRGSERSKICSWKSG
jgi:hypothetical protein